MRIVALIVLLVGAVTAGLLYTGRLAIPPQWNPWAPLDITAAPNFLTRHKLERASRDDGMCRQLIANAELTFTAVEDKVTQPGCGFRNAVRVTATTAQVSEPFALSCRAALSLAMWEHHVMQPAARQHFGAPVSKLEHFGSYSCRTVYNRPNARISHHATADALDVAGFIIGNERVRVLGDWDDPGHKGAFLRAVKTGACDFFDSVLSPEYNAAHRDHFHLDRGPFRICR